MPRLFAAGYMGDGQMGEAEIENESGQCFLEPVEIADAPENIQTVACGLKHTLFLTKNHRVYSVGNNECGQLGRDVYQDESFEIRPVDLKSTIKIIQIAAGQFHNAAVADDGKFYMWGANHGSQCGVKASAKICIPERISVLVNVVQVACGENNTIVLTESCSVFVFGLIDDVPTLPKEIEYLSCLPIVQISAGSCHFAALTAGGQIFCWGKNSNGQTGSDVISDKFSWYPKLVDAISKVVYVTCGSKHTVVLNDQGIIFTFGTNAHGQLGEPNRTDKSNHPKGISELLGTTVSNIACGSRYTIIISNGRALAFGHNNTGQLGIGTLKSMSTPMAVKFISGIKDVFCGTEHTYFLVDDIADPRTTATRAFDEFKIPNFLTYSKIKKLMDGNDRDGIMSEIESVFSSVGCINGSFLFEDGRRYEMGSSTLGLNLDDIMYAMNTLSESSSSKEYTGLIMTSLEMCVVLELEQYIENKNLPLNPEMFRIFFILSWIPQMAKPDRKFIENFLGQYNKLLSKIVEQHENLFVNWWKQLPTRHFNRFSKSLMNVLEHLFPKHYSDHAVLIPILQLIKKMSDVNKEVEKIPYTSFYLNCLEEKVNNPGMIADGVDVPKGPNPFFWFNYPCLMNVVAKSNVLETHSKVLQHTAIENSYRRDIFYILGGGLGVNPFLNFTVRRDNIVEDTVTNLMDMNYEHPEVLFKPLKISFANEEGEDEGGIRKEYFMLLFKEFLQPTYGMFLEDEESNYIWFSGFPVEDYYFKMVGLLCALGIYNSILVELPFPLALYKYLLGVPFTIEDLRDLHPTEGRSLDSLLDYDGDDVEDVFMLYFSISLTVFGHTEEIELKPNGKNIPVTKENKAEFVDLYIKRRMEYGNGDVIKNQLECFKKAFAKLLNREILSLFQPRELMELMAGNENYDWEELKENCQYKDKYHKDHPSIKAFWGAFSELSDEEKKKFLLFLMGTSRIPWKGMSKVDMVIQPTDPTKLPVAHTCFNLLDLPAIEDKDELLRRLRICIDNNQGFTLA
ncbi:hypothetical protein FO519_006701 [Halicephalobus sp. NKZ332]|nr:hypothetical protein FO519_006701 [Halicephalobus sp. NKZ332]